MAAGEVVRAIGAIAVCGGFAVEVIAMIGMSIRPIRRVYRLRSLWKLQSIGALLWFAGVVFLTLHHLF